MLLPKGSLRLKCTSSKKSTSKNKLSHSAFALGTTLVRLLAGQALCLWGPEENLSRKQQLST